MKIIIIGAGKVGHKLAQQLVQEDHDIVVIDVDHQAIAALANSEDVMCITGNAAEFDVQMEAGVNEADLVIACTDSDELNMLCCLMCKHHHAKKTIARVRTPEYFDQLRYIRDELGLSMEINPEMAAADFISRTLIFTKANSIDTFAKGKVELIEFILDDKNPLVGISLRDISDKYRKNKVLVCAVQRGDSVFIPAGDTILEENDHIYVASSHQNIHGFFSEIGFMETPLKSAMIVGGGKVGFYLARQLIKHGFQVKMIEQDHSRCIELSEKLPEVFVVEGDGTDQDLLEEERIANYDAFIALTDIDEINIILSLYAKSRKVEHAYSKVTQIDFNEMLGNLGIESTISPKDITANVILRYVRALSNSLGKKNEDESCQVEALSFLVGGQVEALEFIIKGYESFLGIPFMDLSITKNCLVASIVRNEQVIIPGGKDCFCEGDDIVVFTTNSQIKTLQEIVKVRS